VYTAVAATRGGFTRRNQIVAVGFNLVLYLMYQVPGGAIVLFLFCYFFPFVCALNPDLHFSHGSTAGSSSKEHRRTCLQRNRWTSLDGFFDPASQVIGCPFGRKFITSRRTTLSRLALSLSCSVSKPKEVWLSTKKPHFLLNTLR